MVKIKVLFQWLAHQIVRLIGPLDWDEHCVLAYGIHWGYWEESRNGHRIKEAKCFTIRIPIPFSEYYDYDLAMGHCRKLCMFRREFIYIKHKGPTSFFARVALYRI